MDLYEAIAELQHHAEIARDEFQREGNEEPAKQIDEALRVSADFLGLLETPVVPYYDPNEQTDGIMASPDGEL